MSSLLHSAKLFPAHQLVSKNWVCKCTAEGAVFRVSQVEQLKVSSALHSHALHCYTAPHRS